MKMYGPLFFYKNYHNIFPLLSKIAKMVFCATATSVPWENLFSNVGLIQTDLRNRLNSSLSENLTLIKENM